MRNQKETVLDLLARPRAGENFDRRQTEKELLEAITSKNEELTILHQVNSRLAHELAILQRRLGIDPQVLLHQLQRTGDMPLPVAGRLQYLQPLFLAYDETILKQKKIIAMLYSQLQDFERRSQTLVRENECLLEQGKNKCKKILEIYHRGSPEESLTLAYNRLLRETEQERNDLVRQESEEILQAYQRLELHSEALERELEESRAEGEQRFAQLKQQGEELKEALLSVDNLLKVKQFLEKTVNRMGQQNIALETLKSEQEARIGKLEAELKSLRSQLQTQKKLGRQDAQRITIQLDSLKSEAEHAAKRERQVFNRNMILQKELETFREALRVAKREGERSKADLEQAMRMCDTYQSKVAAAGRKERGLVEALEQGKDRLDATLLERDKALLKVERLEKSLEEMGVRQREEQSRLRGNYQKLVGELQEQVRTAQEEREEGESVFMETELALKNQVQKLTRENSLLREQNLRFVESIHASSGSQIIGKLKEYEAKNDSLLKLLAQRDRQLKELQTRIEEQQHDTEAELRNLTRLVQKERAAATQSMKEVTQERSRASVLASEKECLQGQLRKLKRNQEMRGVHAGEEQQQRVTELETRLAQALRREKETKARACQMLEKYDAAELLYRGEYEKQILELQGQNEKLRRKLEKMKAKANQ